MIRVLFGCGFSSVALVVTHVPWLQTIWVVAPLVGVLVAGVVALENREPATYPSGRRVVLVAGCGGALLVLLVDRIVWLGARGVPVMLVGLVVGVVAGVLIDRDRPGEASALSREETSERA